MNKILIAFAALIAIVTVSCNNSGNKDNNGSASTGLSKDISIKLDKIECSDSINFKGNKAEAYLCVFYPAGSSALDDSIKTYINSILGGNDSISVADNAKASVKNFLAATEIEFNSLGFDNEFPENYEQTDSIVPVFQSPKIITYLHSGYIFTGGAHGSSMVRSRMFDTKTGKTAGWDIIDEAKKAELATTFKEALAKQYFKLAGVNELKDQLLVEGSTFPLPANPPYFMKDGVHFLYGQYEIAPYAMGMPQCVISYDDIKPYLSEFGKTLLP